MPRFGWSFAALLFLSWVIPVRAQDQAPETSQQVAEKIVAREKQEVETIRQYAPLVETYVQKVFHAKDGSWSPAGDHYLIGRARFAGAASVESLTPRGRKGFRYMASKVTAALGFSTRFLPGGFLQMVYVDPAGLTLQNYHFEFVRREFLGEVRALVFDVTPVGKNNKGRFIGRIWADDVTFTIVRFNGTYAHSGSAAVDFHFDSWRMNTGPDLWLPVLVYSEENLQTTPFGNRTSYRAQTRLWAYHPGLSAQQEELSKLQVEAAQPVKDQSEQKTDLTPLQQKRLFDREAEDNVLEKLQKMGLVAPPGELDKLLDTVVNNLEVTNDLDLEPEIRCRVLMTSTIESFVVGHTIVVSRGMIDVLPDEASLAAMLARELGYVLLGYPTDTQFAFFDRVLRFDFRQTFQHFDFARTPEQDQMASAKAAELLNKSPYKDQLRTPRMFMAELQKRAREIPNLISPRLGDTPLAGSAVSADFGDRAGADQFVALPLGSRVKVDPWNDELALLKAKPVGSVAEREKMPFEVTPFILYLTRQAPGG